MVGWAVNHLQDWLVLPSDDDWHTDPSQGGASPAFADIGSHLVDLVEFIIRDQITAVRWFKRLLLSNLATTTAS